MKKHTYSMMAINDVKYNTWTPGEMISDELTATGKIYVAATHAVKIQKLLLNAPWRNEKAVTNSSKGFHKDLNQHSKTTGFSIEICNDGWPRATYALPQYTLDSYTYAIDVANQLFAVAGIDPQTSVSYSSPGTLTFTTSDGKTFTIEYRDAEHLIGTHRMGDEAKNSVVNKDLQAWDHNNLYLVGCGVFPTTATSNPTLTAAALALRADDTIALRLKAT
jgi:hypothetical protein